MCYKFFHSNILLYEILKFACIKIVLVTEQSREEPGNGEISRSEQVMDKDTEQSKEGSGNMGILG